MICCSVWQMQEAILWNIYFQRVCEWSIFARKLWKISQIATNSPFSLAISDRKESICTLNCTFGGCISLEALISICNNLYYIPGLILFTHQFKFSLNSLQISGVTPNLYHCKPEANQRYTMYHSGVTKVLL